MCSICDDIARDGGSLGTSCSCCGGSCGEASCSCQPSTAAVPALAPYNYPPIFQSIPWSDLEGGDTSGGTIATDDPNYQLLVDTHDVMSPGRMDKLMREFFEHLMEKCQRKNKAYAETDATSDALNNFREAAVEHDISKMTYAMILQGKHSKAWKTFVRTGEAPDKAFRILGDIIVYAFIMYCIGVDEGKWKHEEEVLEDGD